MIRDLLLSLFVIASAAACHSTILIHRNDALPLVHHENPPPPEKSVRQGNMIFGIYPMSPKELAICGNQSQPEVKLYTNFADSVIHFFVGPVYSPRTVQIFCRPQKVLQGENWNQQETYIQKEN